MFGDEKEILKPSEVAEITGRLPGVTDELEARGFQDYQDFFWDFWRMSELGFLGFQDYWRMSELGFLGF